MSRAVARRILWIAALALLPLPMLAFGAVVPVVRFALLAAVTAGLIASEGSGPVPVAILALFVAHVLVYGGLLWIGAWLLSGVLAARFERALAPVTCALVLVGLVVCVGFDVYVTPFASLGARTNLLGVLR